MSHKALGVREKIIFGTDFTGGTEGAFDVGRSFFKTIPYGINVTCERLQDSLALMSHLQACKSCGMMST